MRHALTVDIEEWFHVCGVERLLPPSRWPSLPHRARESTLRLLDLLGEVRATFFVLGYVARRDPGLVRSIVSYGHSAQCHGDTHRRVDALAPAAFRSELRDSAAAVADACGVRPAGFRGPGWSHTPWGFEILAEEGFEFDSSVLSLRPRPHRRGGIGEFPVSPLLNGTAIRLLPARTLRGVVAALEARGVPAVVAVHPWDLDPGFPRMRFPFPQGVLHYAGRERAESRLRGLLAAHEFGRPLARSDSRTALKKETYSGVR
ncbi:MAG: polysaccharide deacetylase family protein [Planctomycetes bacterium]|nr:polysaccharide deacetylase family protein [Planctomycetota bacterium]